MDEKALISIIDQAIRTNAEIIRKTMPYGKRNYIDKLGHFHPGNLMNNAYKIKSLGDGKYDIYLDLDIAPYAEYIDQAGYKTYGYWDKAMRKLIKSIAKQLGGTLEEV